MSLLKILALIASLGPKIEPALKLLTALFNLFASEIDAAIGGELEVVELTTEEQCHVDTITQALSADGTQAMFDLSQIRKLVKWARTSPAGKIALDALISIITKAATGG